MVEQAPARTILYYPDIRLPAGRWLRQALLYWEHVGSIVPAPVDSGPEHARFFSPDIDYLRSVGVFRPFYPDQHPLWERMDDFNAEVSELLRSPELQTRPEHEITTPVHKGKLSKDYLEELMGRGLATDPDGDWVRVDRHAALLYMSILAKYLADSEPDLTVPGTNRPEYEQMAFGREAGDQLACAEFSLRGVLPVPRDDVSFDDIIQFRESHREELLQFRGELDQVTSALRQAESERQLKEVLQGFQERYELASRDLSEAFRESAMAVIRGSVKSLLLALVSSFAPIKLAEGAIEITGTIIGGRNTRRAALRGSAFAYLYTAEHEMIV